jgi:hypothetical protein
MDSCKKSYISSQYERDQERTENEVRIMNLAMTSLIRETAKDTKSLFCN